MRISCNGCRVLRKDCSAGCSIRPCLQRMRSSEFQSNATLFLAKFYGRAGLINLIISGPEQLRSDYGRIVNPVHGSVGLMCTGNRHVCEAAVESVLDGRPITAIPSFQGYDIRHVSKNPRPPAPRHLHWVIKNRARASRVTTSATCRRTPVPQPHDTYTGSSRTGPVQATCPPRAGSAGSAATSEDSEEMVDVELDLELRLAPPGARAGYGLRSSSMLLAG